MAPRRQPPKPGPGPKAAPKPKQRRTPPPPPPPSATEKLAASARGMARSARGMAGLLAGVAVIAVAIWLGVRQGDEQGNAGFDDPPQTTAQAPAVPFTSDRDQAKTQSTKEVFAHTCGTCHTLRAAKVKGIIGPDLDRSSRRLTVAVVREQIRTGSLDGAMPANLLLDKDAERVARYVARLARHQR